MMLVNASQSKGGSDQEHRILAHKLQLNHFFNKNCQEHENKVPVAYLSYVAVCPIATAVEAR